MFADNGQNYYMSNHTNSELVRENYHYSLGVLSKGGYYNVRYSF